jgi:hypothetical protein
MLNSPHKPVKRDKFEIKKATTKKLSNQTKTKQLNVERVGKQHASNFDEPACACPNFKRA